jgi:hypothetical protein
MRLPGPEYLFNLHQTILELVGIVLIVLLSLKLILKEILDIVRQFRKR